ncbi:MAG TPA: VOC family protein [Verrucomicrobiae bacterium]|nr:VOC family protein [Verrucomicrobiae bacterium]
MRCFDHIDLRVRNLEEVRSFYGVLLPALGFTKDAKIDGWIQYERTSDKGAAEFFGVTESPNHIANECRIAFWASNGAEVDRLADVVRQAGGRNIEGPGFEVPGYYAVFFEDASGNRFEICYRE